MTPTEDERARFERLYLTHRAAVSNYARRRVSDAAADDVVAEVFAAAWRHRHEPRSGELPWLIAAARNLILHTHRSAGRQERLSARLAEFVPRAESDPFEQIASDLDTSAVVTAAMRRLSETDQEVLRLVAWDQLTPREIAVVIGCSGAAARVRIHRASRRLAQALAASDVAPDPRSAP